MSLLSSAVGLAGGSQVKLIIGVVLITGALAAAGGIWWHIRSLTNTVASLEKEKSDLIVDNKIYKTNNDVLKSNVITLEGANKSTSATAQALIAERKGAQIAIANLAASNLKDKQALDVAKRKLEDLLKDPANDGPVAPVLREIVRSIQQDRSSAK